VDQAAVEQAAVEQAAVEQAAVEQAAVEQAAVEQAAVGLRVTLYAPEQGVAPPQIGPHKPMRLATRAVVRKKPA
jgi:hypothetical protein